MKRSEGRKLPLWTRLREGKGRRRGGRIWRNCLLDQDLSRHLLVKLLLVVDHDTAIPLHHYLGTEEIDHPATLAHLPLLDVNDLDPHHLPLLEVDDDTLVPLDHLLDESVPVSILGPLLLLVVVPTRDPLVRSEGGDIAILHLVPDQDPSPGLGLDRQSTGLLA